jgi:hypothetical protein
MFLHGKHFQTSVMFAGMARSLHRSVSLERGFTRAGSGLTNKHYTRLEKLSMDTHSSLLRNFENYGLKGFVALGTVTLKKSFMKSTPGIDIRG